MKVFLDLVPVDAFRRQKWRKGNKFLLMLSGISISTAGGELTVEPIYTPLLFIDRRGSLVFIEIAWMKPLLLVVVSSSRPFLHFERTDRIVLEEYE
jgi:hypothetical protein